MTEEHEHEAEAIEQDVTSEAAELVNEEAASAEVEAEAEEATAEEADAEESDAEQATAEEADETDEATDGEDGPDAEEESKPRPPAKLERLQKILAQAGVASRRRAEELMTQGRVQVNGKIVTELGSKADAGRDHIRVDGKLLHGAERLRYFMLNKPKGFVTTVKDPEGRNTVMEFFAKMPERLYPVGRLDYQSEGLLVVTNDGELANRLTKASAGVEKTYLVKVAGQPTEAELDILRGGVMIDRAKVGEGRVRTAPARVRQVRQGDNPWYEVVLIEGRNRELRKMFEEIGHFVEKIRRVGYGPLVLDIEPGKLRELEPEELAALRLASEGKLRTPKAKEVRRRNSLDSQLPTLAPRPSRPRAAKPFDKEKAGATGRSGDLRPKRSFSGERAGSTERPSRPGAERPGPAKFGTGRPAERTGPRPAWKGPGRPESQTGARPAWKKDDRPGRPAGRSEFQSGARPAWKRDDRPSRPAGRPAWKKDSGEGRSFGAKPAWNKPASGDRPFKRPGPPRREMPTEAEPVAPPRPSRLRIEPMEPERPTFSRPPFDRTQSERPRTERPRFDGPRPSGGGFGRTGGGPGRTGAGNYGAGRPPRGQGSSRPFTTSTGKPRPGGARPNNKHGKTAGAPYGAGSQSGAGARPAGKTGWKPKPSFDRPGRPASGGRSKPAFGSKPKSSGYKSGGTNRSGPRPGGPRPGGRKRD